MDATQDQALALRFGVTGYPSLYMYSPSLSPAQPPAAHPVPLPLLSPGPLTGRIHSRRQGAQQGGSQVHPLAPEGVPCTHPPARFESAIFRRALPVSKQGACRCVSIFNQVSYAKGGWKEQEPSYSTYLSPLGPLCDHLPAPRSARSPVRRAARAAAHGGPDWQREALGRGLPPPRGPRGAVRERARPLRSLPAPFPRRAKGQPRCCTSCRRRSRTGDGRSARFWRTRWPGAEGSPPHAARTPQRAHGLTAAGMSHPVALALLSILTVFTGSVLGAALSVLASLLPSPGQKRPAARAGAKRD